MQRKKMPFTTKDAKSAKFGVFLSDPFVSVVIFVVTSSSGPDPKMEDL